jgi:8-oxo-dGTP pyrophosphatase MutT (NUDIX family)
MKAMKVKKTLYVIGFVMGEDPDDIIMIKKRRGPDWLIGKWNAIGGKIEPGEKPEEAMAREFREEVGASVPSWEEFACVTTDNGIVHCFRGWDENPADLVLRGHPHRAVTEDELVAVINLARPPVGQLIAPNLYWLARMARDPRGSHGVGHHYKIREVRPKRIYRPKTKETI